MFASLQGFVWAWQSASIALLMHLLLDRQAIDPVLVGIAVLLATIIALSDSVALLQNAQSAAGLAQLIRGGLDVPQSRSARVKQGFQFLGRAVLGALILYDLELSTGAIVRALESSTSEFEPGETVRLSIDWDQVRLFAGGSEALLTPVASNEKSRGRR